MRARPGTERGLEAIRMRLDPSASWPLERNWEVIARTLGYDSPGEAKRAAWRTFNHTAYQSGLWENAHALVTLAEAVGLPADPHPIREALKALDALKLIEDKDPPKPRPLSKAAIRRMVDAQLEQERHTVDADPTP